MNYLNIEKKHNQFSSGLKKSAYRNVTIFLTLRMYILFFKPFENVFQFTSHYEYNYYISLKNILTKMP